RRRHTIFSRDWSSDVCSSDLDIVQVERKHIVFRKRQLGQGNSDFSTPICTEIVAEHHVPFFYCPERIAMCIDHDDWLNKLVRNSFGIGLLNGKNQISRRCTYSFGQKVIGYLHTLPT